ncbi:hypothetical protein K2Z84_33605 [Candidatus Binatia bacterium]|nr:hypothetical protein [Candidatus Binatia bacterium]
MDVVIERSLHFVPAAGLTVFHVAPAPRCAEGCVCADDTYPVRTYPVFMNLTLSIDEKVADEARRAAQSMGMSLNQAVRLYLERLAGREQLEAELGGVQGLGAAERRAEARLDLRSRRAA